MTSLGNLLWIVGIGAVLFLMMRKGGGCCGGGHEDNHESQKKELSGHSRQDAEKKPRGGCCG